MFFRVLLNVLFVACCLSLVPSVHAAEEGGGKEKAEQGGKDGKKEEKKDEKSGEEDLTESQKKQLSEANELQARVQALQARIRAKEESLHKLIEDKEQTKDAAKVKDIISQMVAEHKELTSLVTEYEQQRSLLRYRYPEKGFKGVRTYERMEVKPLEQMESQMSIESKLKRNLKTMRSQYGDSAKDAKKAKPSPKKEDQAPSLTEPLIIEK